MAKRKRPQMELEAGLTVTQLATRIPKTLMKQVKVWCVNADQSIADFVSIALAHELWTVQMVPEPGKIPEFVGIEREGRQQSIPAALLDDVEYAWLFARRMARAQRRAA